MVGLGDRMGVEVETYREVLDDVDELELAIEANLQDRDAVECKVRLIMA